jgi:hypothetical protein
MITLFKRSPPAVQAMLLQIGAVAIVLTSLSLMALRVTPLLMALCCGVLAALFSYLLRQARWWWLIQLGFMPAVVVMLAWDLPPSLFLTAFFIFVLVYWSTFRTQVPLYLSSNKVWSALEGLLPAADPDMRFTFIDLGSGLGGVLTHLAVRRTDGRYLGVEAAPLPCLWSVLHIKWLGLKNCQIRWGSMWDCDLAKYDVVFAYLSPVPMAQLWQKARTEMRSGSLFISSTFVVLDHPPQRTVQVDDLHHSTLYIWEM